MDEQLVAARKAKQDIRESKNESSIDKKILFLNNQINSLKKENELLKKQLDEQKKYDFDELIKQNIILEDLIKHSPNSDFKNDDYKPETINLALQIRSISQKAYDILHNNLFFPNKSYIMVKFHESISDLPEKITNTENVGEIINIWKQKFNIPKSQVIKACLAVDALYFKPDIKITMDNLIFGMITDNDSKVFLPKDSIQYFTNKPSSFEKFLALNWNKIIKAGFVFQIQPYDFKYKPFVVHIFPSTNGKASCIIVDLLFQIRELAKNRRIRIKSFAFDGDNAYHQLHLKYFNSYVSILLFNNKFHNVKAKIMRVVSDYFHLLKRLRYRLLSCIIHCGFTIDSKPIIIEEIKSILNEMGEVIWCNDRYTKMHDKLPIELFKTENLIKLIESEQLSAAAYWFPATMSLIAINNGEIEIKFRKFLLECSLFFMVYYNDIWEKNDGNLRQRKHGDLKDVVFYTKELVIEFVNTMYSHLHLMSDIKDYHFSSNGTGPLEHKFGYARVKSHDVNTLSRFIYVISSIQTVENEDKKAKFIDFNKNADKIKGRINDFGVSVKTEGESNENEYDDELPYTPQTVAKVFLSKAGFNIQANWMIDEDDVIYWTSFFLKQFIDDKPKMKKRNTITMNTYLYGTDNCQRAKAIITGKPVKGQYPTNYNKMKKQKLFDDICFEKLRGKPSKYYLLQIVHFIKEIDPNCDFDPGKKTPKSEIYDWIIENLEKYFVIIDNYNENK